MRLDNPGDKEAIQETLRQGAEADFWQIIKQSIEQSLAVIQSDMDGSDINDLPAAEYKIQNEILKSNKKYLEKMMDLPQNIIDGLNTPDQTEPDLDPYDKDTDSDL